VRDVTDDSAAASSPAGAAGALSASEVETLAMAPLLGGNAVMAAAPSGGVGRAQEVAALAAAVTAAVAGAQPGTLLGTLAEPVRDLARRVQAADGGVRLVSGVEEALAAAVDACRAAAELLAAEVSVPDGAAYRAMLLAAAARVAHAAREGGFLGFGGQQVSEAEQRVLDALRDALGDPPDADAR
jgi:hypothetical protein